MKLLYAVQATGNGHITRARVMAKAFARLQAEGYEFSVQWLFSGRERDQLFEMAPFGDYLVKKGLSFAISNGRIDLWASWRQNALLRCFKDISSLDLSGYDLVINDFEPISAWAARRQKVDSIGISHQMSFAWHIPQPGGHWFAKQILRYFAPVNQAVGFHWYHFDAPLLPPVIECPTEYRTQAIHPLQKQRQILVYYPFVPLTTLIQLFSLFPDYQFHVFYPGTQERRIGHIHLYQPSRTQFQKTQIACGGVITAAGFELPSEAIQLGQKLLIVPIAGQFEQESNAMALKRLGRATVIRQLNQGDLAKWLRQPTFHPHPWPDVGYALAKWIVSGRKESLESLSTRFWSQTDSALQYGQPEADPEDPDESAVNQGDETVTSCL